MTKNHPFHMVTKSPWPILSSINLMTMILGTVYWMNKKEMNMNMMLGNIMLISCATLWWKNISMESTFQGHHTNEVSSLMKMGMIMFISSEVMLFFSLFWLFFHNSLSTNIELGMMWPPKSIITFNPMEIPLLNTIILLTSGSTITWAHHLLLLNKSDKTNKMIMFTIILGTYFTMLQMMEYKQSQFTFSDSSFGSTFFLMTGFHGIHVIVGTLFIMSCLIRMMMMHFTKSHHVGFELAAWYWHFVDVVWLFLYLSVYWWSN